MRIPDFRRVSTISRMARSLFRSISATLPVSGCGSFLQRSGSRIQLSQRTRREGARLPMWKREAKAKLRAAFGAIAGGDQAVVRHDHLLDDRQAQARAVGLRR